MKISIGARILKTSLAVFFTLYIVEYFGLEYGFFAAMAAVLTIKPSITKSITYIREVLGAHIIATVVSLIGVLIVGVSPLSIAFFVIITIAINIKLNLKKTVELVVLTMVAIMTTSGDGSGGLDIAYVFNRVSLILIGITTALIINVIVFPPNYKKVLIESFKEIDARVMKLFRSLMEEEYKKHSFNTEIKGIEKELMRSGELLELVIEDSNKGRFKNKFSKLRKIVTFKRLETHLNDLKEFLFEFKNFVSLIEEFETTKKVSRGDANSLKKLVYRNSIVIYELSDHLFDKYVENIDGSLAANKNNKNVKIISEEQYEEIQNDITQIISILREVNSEDWFVASEFLSRLNKFSNIVKRHK